MSRTRPVQVEAKVSPRLGVLLTQIADTSDVETALRKVLTDYLRLKIEALQIQIESFEEKWRMSFSEFAQACEEGTLDDAYSYEVESDYWEWEEAETLLHHYDSLRERWI